MTVLLRLILVLAIGSSAMGANRMPAMPKASAAAAASGGEHACCKPTKPSHDEKDKTHDCGKCLMTCCRIVTAPADPITTAVDVAPLAIRIALPPLLVHDLGEPPSIFHPPRA